MEKTYEYLFDKYGVALSAQEAAEEIGLHCQTISNLCLKGEIKAKKMGNKWLVFTEGLVNYLKADDNSIPIIPLGKTKRGFKKIV